MKAVKGTIGGNYLEMKEISSTVKIKGYRSAVEKVDEREIAHSSIQTVIDGVGQQVKKYIQLAIDSDEVVADNEGKTFKISVDISVEPIA